MITSVEKVETYEVVGIARIDVLGYLLQLRQEDRVERVGDDARFGSENVARIDDHHPCRIDCSAELEYNDR